MVESERIESDTTILPRMPTLHDARGKGVSILWLPVGGRITQSFLAPVYSSMSGY
jgi:hypothetical protein